MLDRIDRLLELGEMQEFYQRSERLLAVARPALTRAVLALDPLLFARPEQEWPANHLHLLAVSMNVSAFPWCTS